jgi:hypothetical protein
MLSRQWRRRRHGPFPKGLWFVHMVVRTVAVAGTRPEGSLVVRGFLISVEGGVMLCPDGSRPKGLL